jgi:high affinity Mn2+ porin
MGRSQDTLAIAGVVNGISDAHSAGWRRAAWACWWAMARCPIRAMNRSSGYYALRPVLGALTFDYQHIANPGYNRDRGPANIFALRVHAGF